MDTGKFVGNLNPRKALQVTDVFLLQNLRKRQNVVLGLQTTIYQ